MNDFLEKKRVMFYFITLRNYTMYTNLTSTLFFTN